MASTDPKRRGERKGRTAQSTVFPRQRRDDTRGAEVFDILAPTGSQPAQRASRRPSRKPADGASAEPYRGKTAVTARNRRAIPSGTPKSKSAKDPQTRHRLWEQAKDSVLPQRIMAVEKDTAACKPVIDPSTTGDAHRRITCMRPGVSPWRTISGRAGASGAGRGSFFGA